MSSSSSSEYTEEQEKITLDILSKDKHEFYEMLNVERTASENDIKKAYRKLAIKLHPDKNRHPRASEAFKKINRAFEVLSDDSKRRIFDQLGYDPDDRAAAQESYRGGGGPGGSNSSATGPRFRGPPSFDGSFGAPEDIFEFLFRGGGPGNQFGASPFGGAFNGPFGAPFGHGGGGATYTFGGPGGFKVYTNYDSPFARRAPRPQPRRNDDPGERKEESNTQLMMLIAPFLIIILLNLLERLLLG
ncbi:Protein HLJ1 [Kluyveromyces marxianus]